MRLMKIQGAVGRIGCAVHHLARDGVGALPRLQVLRFIRTPVTPPGELAVSGSGTALVSDFADSVGKTRALHPVKDNCGDRPLPLLALAARLEIDCLGKT